MLDAEQIIRRRVQCRTNPHGSAEFQPLAVAPGALPFEIPLIDRRRSNHRLILPEEECKGIRRCYEKVNPPL